VATTNSLPLRAANWIIDRLRWPVAVTGIVLFFAVNEGLTFNRVGRWVRIDLYRPDTLNGFGRAALNYLLMVVGAMALTTVQAIDQEFRAENYLNALYVAVPAALVLVTLPIWPIHRRMRTAKRVALAELDAEIARARQGLDAESLGRLNALLERRAYLHALRTWPMDLAIFSRFVLYVFIPPLAWAGAALVEMVLDSYLAG